MHSRIPVVFLMTVSALLLSTWGPQLLNIAGYYVPELMLIVALLYCQLRGDVWLLRRVAHCALTGIGAAATAWLVLVAALGVLNTGSVSGPYSEMRSSLILVYALVYYRKYTTSGPGTVRTLHFLILATLCLDFLLLAIQVVKPPYVMQYLALEGKTVEESVDYGLGRFAIPAIGILAAAYLSSREQRVMMLILTLIIGSLSSLGGHRLVLLVTAFSSLFLPVSLLRTSFFKDARQAMIACAGVAAVCLGVYAVYKSGFVERYFDTAAGIRQRLVVRTIDSIEGASSGISGRGVVDYGDESIRAAYLYYIATQIPRLLLPHGLGSREVEGKIANFEDAATKFGVDPRNGNTHDMMILYMVYHHGVFGALLWFGYTGMLLLNRWNTVSGVGNKALFLLPVAGLIIIDLVFPPVPGVGMSFTYGALLGVVSTSSELTKNRRFVRLPHGRGARVPSHVPEVTRIGVS